jgi:hypothetical protein
MIDILAALLAILATDLDVERLRASAPQYLTSDQARAHLGAARAGGLLADEDPYLLLATALRESNYRANVVYREASGALSCGVVQAPGLTWADCRHQMTSLAYGYLSGAQHLANWRANARCRGSTACALGGYAGGYPYLDACGHSTAGPCGTATKRMALADAIRGPAPRDSSTFLAW